MKKYVTPILEIIKIDNLDHLLDESQTPYGDSKPNDLIDDDVEIEDIDESLWGDDLWSVD